MSPALALRVAFDWQLHRVSRDLARTAPLSFRQTRRCAEPQFRCPGSLNRYMNYGCRCEPCRAAVRAYKSQRKVAS